MIREDVPTTPANDVTEADAIIEKKQVREVDALLKYLLLLKKNSFL